MVQNEKPWLNEPDYKRWRDGETQLMCLVLRAHSTGSLCGYVRLPAQLGKKVMRRKGRAKASLAELFGVPPKSLGSKSCRYNGYDLGVFESVTVHGGLTFAGKISTRFRGKEKGVWVGFDCGHYNDLSPKTEEYFERVSHLAHFEPRIYRDIGYVTEQTRSLARQIKEIAA